MVSYSVLSVLLVALVSSVVQADTNTNTCLALLGALNANCPQSSLIPSQSCCIAVSNFNKAGCFCNPTMSTLAGASNLALIQDVVKPVCLVLSVNPLWWWSNIINKVNWGKVDCTPFKTFTYNGGTCSSNDMQLDNARISASIGISTTIQSYVAQPVSQCFNYQQFLSDLSVFLDPAPVVTVGYGVGSYTDLASAAEYLALVSPKVNKNFWLFQAPPSTSDPNAVLAVIPGGSTIILGATGGGSWFNNCTVSASGYMEQNIIFEGCNTVIKNYFVPGTSVVTGQPTNLHNFVTKFYLAAQDTDTWGIQNICNYHETYCTGTNKQFVSFSECLRFMNALPAISPTCGNGLIMSGNSSTCRFKHAFMAPLDPGAHCFHIGYGDRADKNNHFKCNDQLECTPSNPSLSDPTALSLVSSPADTACTSRDESTYTTWQAPSGICSSSIAGRRVLREAN